MPHVLLSWSPPFKCLSILTSMERRRARQGLRATLRRRWWGETCLQEVRGRRSKLLLSPAKTSDQANEEPLLVNTEEAEDEDDEPWVPGHRGGKGGGGAERTEREGSLQAGEDEELQTSEEVANGPLPRPP